MSITNFSRWGREITSPMNNYARVVSVSADGKTITYTSKTTDGMDLRTLTAAVAVMIPVVVDRLDGHLYIVTKSVRPIPKEVQHNGR